MERTSRILQFDLSTTDETQGSVPPLFDMPPGWQACAAGFEKELAEELKFNFFHPLRNVKAVSVARADATDDVLFQLHGFKAPLALVHLTWSKEYHPDWPSCSLFQSWEEWREAVLKWR